MYALSRMAQAPASVRPGPASRASAATASSLIRAPARSHSSSSADFTSRRRVYSPSRNSTWPAAARSLSCERAGTGPMTPVRLPAVDEGVIDPAPLEQAGQRATAALHLGRGEGRVPGPGRPGGGPARDGTGVHRLAARGALSRAQCLAQYSPDSLVAAMASAVSNPGASEADVPASTW